MRIPIKLQFWVTGLLNTFYKSEPPTYISNETIDILNISSIDSVGRNVSVVLFRSLWLTEHHIFEFLYYLYIPTLSLDLQKCSSA